jgi:hypothetical protein
MPGDPEEWRVGAHGVFYQGETPESLTSMSAAARIEMTGSGEADVDPSATTIREEAAG